MQHRDIKPGNILLHVQSRSFRVKSGGGGGVVRGATLVSGLFGDVGDDDDEASDDGDDDDDASDDVVSDVKLCDFGLCALVLLPPTISPTPPASIAAGDAAAGAPEVASPSKSAVDAATLPGSPVTVTNISSTLDPVAESNARESLTGSAVPDPLVERAAVPCSGGGVAPRLAAGTAAAAEVASEDARITAAVAALPAACWECSRCVGSPPGFVAPEVVIDDAYDGRAADVWSLGCIALELHESSVGDAFDRTWCEA